MPNPDRRVTLASAIKEMAAKVATFVVAAGNATAEEREAAARRFLDEVGELAECADREARERS